MLYETKFTVTFIFVTELVSEIKGRTQIENED